MVGVQPFKPPPAHGRDYPCWLAAAVSDPSRVRAVRGLAPRYSPRAAHFDRLTDLAAQLLAAPVALLTLVDRDRQFFVSSYGLTEPVRSARETPLDYSICQHAVASGLPLVVPDTINDARLASNGAVVEFGVKAYAGVPLITDDRWPVGTLCVIDFVVRHWTDDQLAHLARLATICMDEIQLAGFAHQVAFAKAWGGVPENPRRTFLL